MSNIKTWSTTAASNTSASPDGWPTSMAPSGVDDSAREMMASIKTWHDDGWANIGHTCTYASATTFTIASTDYTSIYTPGRRIRIADATTVYGLITASSFATDTTVTVLIDGGTSLTSSMTGTNVSLGAPVNAQPTSMTISSGQGVNFPDTFSDNSDVNTLDDYEEGTFTPVIWDDTLATASPTAPTYINQVGTYTKIGNLVRIGIDISLSSLGSLAGWHECHIGGLPFGSADHGPIYVGFASGLSIVASNCVSGYIVGGTSRINLSNWDTVGGTSALLVSEFSADGRLILSATYKG